MDEKEYIEREAEIAVIYGQHVGGKEACENARPNTYGADLREIVADIEDIHAADVRPVVRGRDISSTVRGHCEFKCSVCGVELSSVYGGLNDFGMDGGRFNFCPNCGADMREES